MYTRVYLYLDITIWAAECVYFMMAPNESQNAINISNRLGKWGKCTIGQKNTTEKTVHPRGYLSIAYIYKDITPNSSIPKENQKWLLTYNCSAWVCCKLAAHNNVTKTLNLYKDIQIYNDIAFYTAERLGGRSTNIIIS